MTSLLEQAGILEKYASLLDDQARQAARKAPGEYQEALQEAERGLIPTDAQTERLWISQHTSPSAATT